MLRTTTLLLTLLLTSTCQRTHNVLHLQGVPGNTRDVNPVLQFVDLGEPVVSDYQVEPVEWSPPFAEPTRNPATSEPLYVEYNHNPAVRLPPKHIQVVEVDPKPRRTREAPSEHLRRLYSANLAPRVLTTRPVTPEPDDEPAETEEPVEVTTKRPAKVEIERVLKGAEKRALEETLRRQAESAVYEFASNVDDRITGNQHRREEVREGLNVEGEYSYSDGYYRHTVRYVADDKGYRIVKNEMVPLGDGPTYNPEGDADVEAYVAGTEWKYRVTEEDYAKRRLASRRAKGQN